MAVNARRLVPPITKRNESKRIESKRNEIRTKSGPQKRPQYEFHAAYGVFNVQDSQDQDQGRGRCMFGFGFGC